MKLKKKYVIRTFILMILIALIVGGALFAREVLFSNESKVIYGTRSKNAKKNAIPEETLTKAKDALKEETKSIDIRIQGRIVNIIIKVKDDATLENAKSLGVKASEYFNDYSSYYDIQIMIEKDTESKQFPIIGYKHHDIATKKYTIIWTKDRAEN